VHSRAGVLSKGHGTGRFVVDCEQRFHFGITTLLHFFIFLLEKPVLLVTFKSSLFDAYAI
jgi:hypothetical protein